jgi:hypothetical protein
MPLVPSVTKTVERVGMCAECKAAVDELIKFLIVQSDVGGSLPEYVSKALEVVLPKCGFLSREPLSRIRSLFHGKTAGRYIRYDRRVKVDYRTDERSERWILESDLDPGFQLVCNDMNECKTSLARDRERARGEWHRVILNFAADSNVVKR